MPAFKRILVPLDGSALAEAVLDPAVSLGTPGVTTYTLLTVVAPLLVGVHPYPGRATAFDRDDLARRRQEAQTYLDRVAGELRRSAATVDIRVTEHLQAAPGILETAAAEGVDLIALATRGRGALPRLVLGSVADKVVRGAETSVLVLRPSDSRPASAPQSAGESDGG